MYKNHQENRSFLHNKIISLVCIWVVWIKLSDRKNFMNIKCESIYISRLWWNNKIFYLLYMYTWKQNKHISFHSPFTSQIELKILSSYCKQKLLITKNEIRRTSGAGRRVVYWPYRLNLFVRWTGRQLEENFLKPSA